MVVDNITRTIMTRPVPEWGLVLETEDYPREYYFVFAAMAVNFIALAFPPWLTVPVMTFFAQTLLRNLHEARTWILNMYLPSIVEATRVN